MDKWKYVSAVINSCTTHYHITSCLHWIQVIKMPIMMRKELYEMCKQKNEALMETM